MGGRSSERDVPHEFRAGSARRSVLDNRHPLGQSLQPAADIPCRDRLRQKCPGPFGVRLLSDAPRFVMIDLQSVTSIRIARSQAIYNTLLDAEEIHAKAKEIVRLLIPILTRTLEHIVLASLTGFMHLSGHTLADRFTRRVGSVCCQAIQEIRRTVHVAVKLLNF